MSKFEDFLPQSDTKLKVVSLFSGIGGIDLGFQRAGFEIVATLDFDKKTCNTLNANKGKWVSENTKVVQADITTLDPKDLYQGEVDFVIGGPPCQSFSAIGRRAGGAMGTKDARGGLFEHYCRMLEYFKPKGFLFENVRGILYANKSNDWNNVLSAFQALGYVLKYRVLDAADYGVAQHRERVLLVGYKQGEFFYPRPTHGPNSGDGKKHVSAQEALDGVEITALQKLLPNGGKYDHLLKDVPPGMNYLYYTKEMGHPEPKFAWRSKFSDFLYKADPLSPTKTIVAKMGKYSGPFHWEGRRLATEELRRLQGFPDDFVITGSRIEQVQQIGNSVVPHMAYNMALAVRKTIFGLDTDVNLISDDFALKLDARKGKKARKTRSMAIDNEACSPASLFDSLENRKEIEIRRVPVSGYLKYEKNKISVVKKAELTNSRWYADFTLNGKKIDIKLINKDNNNHEQITLNIKFKDGVIGIKEICLNIDGVVPEELFVAWDAVNYVISQVSSYPSIHELYGHFTEPNPQFSLEIESGPQLKRNPLTDFFIWSGNLETVNNLHPKGVLTSFGFDTSTDERSLLKQLRKMRFDVRTHLTNKQIPEDKFKICYPYALPYDRQSFITIG